MCEKGLCSAYGCAEKNLQGKEPPKNQKQSVWVRGLEKETGHFIPGNQKAGGADAGPGAKDTPGYH